MSVKLIVAGAIGLGAYYFWQSKPSYAGISGPGITGVSPIQFTGRLADWTTVYAIQNVVSGYLTNIVLITSTGEQRLIRTESAEAVEIASFFDPSKWSTYETTSGYNLVA